VSGWDDVKRQRSHLTDVGSSRAKLEASRRLRGDRILISEYSQAVVIGR
jgi:hypothetical protein